MQAHWVSLCVVLTLAGCSYPVNLPIRHWDARTDYRFRNLTEADPNKNGDGTFVILTFSGGGTRAAALSYGVLEQLRGVQLDGGRKTLLDEVDVISSVSGGSFTAAYYGLFGQEAFFRDFKEAVLYRPLESDLLLRILAPWNWPRLLSPKFGRSDLADEYYDGKIFQHHTFADMPHRRPFIIMNATDITEGAQFSFVQEHFDRLCSDLSSVHISRAVTASSAFPVAFTPLTLKNYDKTCGYQRPEWVDTAYKEDFENAPRRYSRAANWVSYEDANRRPYIHLMDGGLADNIGLREPEFGIAGDDSGWELHDKVNREKVKRIVVIIVDAKPHEESALDTSARPPKLISVLNASATNPMENYSADTVEFLREDFAQWDTAAHNFERRQQQMARLCDQLSKEVCASSRSRGCEATHRAHCRDTFYPPDTERPIHPKLYRIHVRFRSIKDAELRARLETTPTRLQLPRRDVDALVHAGNELLHDSEAYQRLLGDLQTEGD